MPFEDPQAIEELNPSWPLGTDPKSQGDDHIRGTKLAITNSLPNMTGPWATTDPITAGDAVDPTHLVTKQQLDATMTSWGVVGAGGSSAATPGSGDFTSARIGAGHFRLTFNKAATGNFQNQSCVATVEDPDNRACTVVVASDTIVDVYIKNTQNGVAVDDPFHFQRIA